MTSDMWNHAQNNDASGDDENNDVDANSGLKERVEKSLDLTQYLKYLDQLFSQATSESESSDSEDGEGNHRAFNDFLQPPVQPVDRSQLQSQFSQNYLGVGGSHLVSDSNHFVNSTVFKGADNFHLDSNISSSSLSSVDSGTSSLSLALSSENGTESSLQRVQESSLGNNGVSESAGGVCGDASNASGEGDKTDESGSEKEKKSQKKKKSNKGSTESLPRQNKPSSGGKGNGSKGGGTGSSSGSGSSDSSGSSSSSSSSSNQNCGGSNSSCGAKNRSGKQSLQQANAQEVIEAACVGSMEEVTGTSRVNSCTGLNQSFEDGQLTSMIESSDGLLLNGDLTDTFADELLSTDTGSVETFESGGFPFTEMLDIHDDEDSISDYISMDAAATSSSSQAQNLPQSLNFMNKIAAAAASSALSKFPRNNTAEVANNAAKESLKFDAKKRKLEGNFLKPTPGKFAKLTDKQKQTRLELLNAKRRKVYVYICRKEIGKTQRNRANIFKESLAMKRKLAHACARHMRKQALQSQKCMKESVCKAKRLTQEMEMYWKLVERSERDVKRKKEKEAEDKLKQDFEIYNKRLKERKLNKLVIQAELLAFKLNPLEYQTSEAEILSKLDETKDERIAHLDNYESDKVKASILLNIDRALKEHQNLVRLLDMSGLYNFDNAITVESHYNEVSHPQMFEGVLKSYQLNGMRWLKKLFTLGLNGILADDAGLGKKQQAIAFLSHLAESCGVWGPFLVVVPERSLYRWQQEFDRMSPRLKVVPYWGKPMERKILRQFWERNSRYREEASFHVVVTSYEIMMTDLKYFSKVKWQYMIMDDSLGAITSSAKWMPLLSFRCRNKLLLANCTRLNSQSHLCSYLYFIMPSLFDSQEEFSDWLLKELESSQVDKKRKYDNNTLLRIENVIMKFLLQRSKQDVESEEMQNIDLHIYCSLSRRQRQIHDDILQGIDLKAFVQDLESCKPEEIRNRIKEMLLLSLKLRKNCNHPDLVSEKEYSVPFSMRSISMSVPKLVHQYSTVFNESRSGRQAIERLFCIFNALNVYRSVYAGALEHNVTKKSKEFPTWGCSRILGLSCSEVENIFLNQNSERLINLVNFQLVLEKLYFSTVWRDGIEPHSLMAWSILCSTYNLARSKIHSKLIFTSFLPTMYTWGKCKIFSTPETIEHRSLRSRKAFPGLCNPPIAPEIKHIVRKTIVRSLQPLEYPKFLRCYLPKVFARGFEPLVNCKKADRYIRLAEKRCLFSEHFNTLKKRLLGQNVMDNVWKSILARSWTHILSRDFEQLVFDSGKLKRLDGLLSRFRQNGNRVLICSYIPESLEILEDFCKLRRWKYAKIDNKELEQPASNVFVYLLAAQHSLLNLNTPIDTVIFYDQDWDVKLEEQKSRIINMLGNIVFEAKPQKIHPNQVNCYRLICKGTIEERILRLTKERHIVSLALCKDVLENAHVSPVPSLKGLASILINEFTHRKKAWDPEIKQIIHKEQSEDGRTQENKSFNLEVQKMNNHTKDIRSGAVYGEAIEILDYVIGTGGSNSASPSCSEDLDSAEIEGGIEIKEYQDADNFRFSFDEGYIGMSPDSFEDVTIKSDYEEDSSPKRPKFGRGTGKRGRPPSRIRFQIRHTSDGSPVRRSPGRPRLKPVGPANQGVRGRKPGRPPLAKKAETISTGLTPLSSGQRVFGFYNSPDLELS